MSAGTLNTARNLSLYAVPAAWIMAVLPHWYSIGAGKFNNKNPRTFARDTENDQSVDKATKGKIMRANAAQMNGFENLALFASAVVIGNVAKLDNWTLNALSASYLATRALYNVLYITGTTDAIAGARSVSFLTGVGIIWTFFIKSGNKIVNQL